MSVNEDAITVEDSTPTFPKVLTVVSTGSTTTGVKGVKGEAEAEYRDGYVNITPANIGFVIIEINSSSGVLPEDHLHLLVNNPQNLIGYEVSNGKSYIFRLKSISSNNWVYGAINEEHTIVMSISLDATTGAYSYSEAEIQIEEELDEHINNQNIHVSSKDRESWDSKLTCDIDGDVLELISN